MRRFSLPVLTTVLVMSATTTLALPTDMGRSADVYENAVRYFAVRSNDPAFWPSPKERPVYFASLATPDETEVAVAATIEATPVPLVAPRDRIAGAPVLVIANAAIVQAKPGPVIAEASPSLDQPEAPDVVAQTAPAGPLNAVAQAAAPELIAPEEGAIIETDIAEAANDLAPEAPVAAVSTVASAPSETEAATVDATVQPALAAVASVDAVAGSSRQTLSPDVEAIPAADAPVADGDLMSQMADADENLVMRDGGEDGPDTMMMSSDVLFSFGRATLADDALATLSSIGDMAGSVSVIEVFGHTDAIGSEANNLALGQRRAEAVRDWLLQNTAFTEDRIIATGIGEVDPVAPNLAANGDDNPDGRAQNRRVEFAFHEAGYIPE